MTTAQQVIDIAKGQVGFREGFSGGHWNNIEPYAAQVPGLEWANGFAYCDVGVCWCFHSAGLADFPVTASCAVSVAGWKARGRWGDTPRVGAQVMFGPGGGEHTGIVGSFDATYIYTIEFNTNVSGSPEGDGVYLKTHRRTDPYVYGYGYPAYDDVQAGGGGIVSGGVTIPGTPVFPTSPMSITPAPTQEDDDMSHVMSAKTATGEGFYLVTPFGRVALGTMGQVDACLSALNARSTRTWNGTSWVINHTPCLQSEADILESLEASIRNQQKAV
jgi:hypothetical protein